MNDTIWFFILVIPLIAALRVVAVRLDRNRIRDYVESAGGKLIDISWNPFGPGWLSTNERLYDVRFKNRNGEMRTSTCKTSMFSGVYWTDPTLNDALP